MEILEILIIILFVLVFALLLNIFVLRLEIRRLKQQRPVPSFETEERKPQTQPPPELSELLRVLRNVENYKGSDEGMIKAVKK